MNFLLAEVSSTLESVGQLISVLLIFVIVLGITYFTTKWIAGYQKGMMKNKNIKVVETFGLSSGKYVQILKIGEKFIAVAVCKDSVTKLADLSPEEVEEFSLNEGATKNESFAVVLDKFKNLKPKK